MYDKSNIDFRDSDEEKEFEHSHHDTQIPLISNGDDDDPILYQLKGQLPITDSTPLITRPESASSSQQTSGRVIKEAKQKETTTTDITTMSKLCQLVKGQQLSVAETTTQQGSGGYDDDDDDDADYATIDSNADEYKKVYVVRYNDEEGLSYDYKDNNDIGLDIDIDIGGSNEEVKQLIDPIEEQSQESLLRVSDDTNNSKTLHVQHNSCQLRYRSKGATSAPDLTSLLSRPTTSVSSSSSHHMTETDDPSYVLDLKSMREAPLNDAKGIMTKKRNMSSTSLRSSIMKKENSTDSLTSLRSSSSSSSVRFGSVEIHEHSIELGCSVHSVRNNGPSVTLGWERTFYEVMDSIEDHKKQKEAPSPSKNKNNNTNKSTSPFLRPRSAEERIDKLLENGYTMREIRSSICEDRKERTRLKKAATKRRFGKRTMSLPDFSTLFTRK